MRRFIRIVLLIIGLGLFFSPALATIYSNLQSASQISEFEQVNGTVEPVDDTGNDDGTDGTGSKYNIIKGTPELLSEIQAYNQSLYDNGQDVMDSFTMVQDNPTGISGLDDGIFGYVTIPAMDVELPIYIGASDGNMAKGAAVIGGTSIPIGGINTNCVLAGHRGYQGIPYFREIEKLEVGDYVYVTNPWETMTYRVESIDIINPNDSDRLKIQEGKDMITLFTCHPYRSHGKYRYLVYCVRDEDGTAVLNDTDSAIVSDNTIQASDGTVYESSGGDIQFEKILPVILGAAIIICFIVCSVPGKKRRRR